MNYESEFQLVLEQSLSKLYGLNEPSVLYAYFQLRYRIWSYKEKNEAYLTESRRQVEFLLKELNLPRKEGRFRYKGQWFLAGFSLKNSLLNIMETWNFEQSIKTITNEQQISINMFDYVDNQWIKIKRFAINKSKPHKNTSSYPYYFWKHALKSLNDVFQATPISSFMLPDVDYPPEHNHIERTMEEICEMYIHSEEIERTDTISISERDVEDFIKYRLWLIEEGLTFIAQQVAIPDGRIDILGKDREGTYVIIELKISDSKEIVYQALYYPEALKKKFGITSHIRMMTLAPTYSPSILSTLKSLSHVEIYTFVPEVKLGELTDLEVFCLYKHS